MRPRLRALVSSLALVCGVLLLAGSGPVSAQSSGPPAPTQYMAGKVLSVAYGASGQPTSLDLQVTWSSEVALCAGCQYGDALMRIASTFPQDQFAELTVGQSYTFAVDFQTNHITSIVVAPPSLPPPAPATSSGMAGCSSPDWQFEVNGNYESPGPSDVGSGDPSLIVCNGTTYVPVRFLADATDSTINYVPGQGGGSATIVIQVPWSIAAPPQAPQASGGAAGPSTAPTNVPTSATSSTSSSSNGEGTLEVVPSSCPGVNAGESVDGQPIQVLCPPPGQPANNGVYVPGTEVLVIPDGQEVVQTTTPPAINAVLCRTAHIPAGLYGC